MANTITRNEILDSIDRVGSITMESSLDVLFSVADSYDKAAMIMENYNGDDLDMFSIFQEAEEATSNESKSSEEAKPEGEGQSSAVQQGDPSGQTTADAKKKEDTVLYKIIHFIPRLFQKIWQFIKDTWNGVIVPESKTVVTTVSDKTAEIFDKIAGKDEAWLKKYGPALGLSAGAIGLLGGVLGFLNREKIKNWVTEWHNSVKALFMRMSATPKLAFENGSITTNIKLSGLKDTITKCSDISKRITFATDKLAQSGCTAAEGKKILNEIIRDYESYKNAAEQDPFIVDGTPYADAVRSNQELVDELFFLVDYFKKVEVPQTVPENGEVKNEAMADTEVKQKVSLLNKISTVIGKFLTGTSNFVKTIYEWVTGFFKKTNEIEKQLENEYGTSKGDKDQPSTEDFVSGNPMDDVENPSGNGNTGDGSGDLENPTAENVDQPVGDGSDNTPVEHKKGDVVSAEEALKMLQDRGKWKVGRVENGRIVNKDGQKHNSIPFQENITDSDGNTYNHIKYDESKGGYVLEYAVDEDDDGVVSEYVSSWYSR